MLRGCTRELSCGGRRGRDSAFPPALGGRGVGPRGHPGAGSLRLGSCKGGAAGTASRGAGGQGEPGRPAARMY